MSYKSMAGARQNAPDGHGQIAEQQACAGQLSDGRLIVDVTKSLQHILEVVHAADGSKLTSRQLEVLNDFYKFFFL